MEDLQKIKEFFSKDINEQADHVNPMVAKAYKDYIKAKKDSAADVDFAEDPEKAYRYYSKKLNNTYTTRADRDAIEAILKKKYGSALEEVETNTSEDIPDIIAVDVPLFIRLLEFAREDAGDDMDLHEVAERAIEAVKLRGVLSMDDYKTLVASKEELDEYNDTMEPPVDRETQIWQRNREKAQRWAQRNATKNYIPYKGLVAAFLTFDNAESANKFFNDTRMKRIVGENISLNEDSFEDEWREKVAKVSKWLESTPEHSNPNRGAMLKYVSIEDPIEANKYWVDAKLGRIIKEQDLTERIYNHLSETIKLGKNLNEELCPKGKAYIKKRMAAGEKSSAYLSGRAVKVCKGQMKG
jgi:hypothetical protein